MIDPGGLLEKLYTRLHLRTYRKRLQKQHRFDHARVISIGNLSMGGTGKTPLTLALAEAALKRKISAMVILRGYGGKRTQDPMLISDGSQCLASYEEAGDEAMLFARLPGLKVAVGRDRIQCIKQFGMQSQLLLLDDAFQNPSVARQHELVLIDASVPFSDLRIFPMGHFRESLPALKRAHTIVLTRADQTTPENLENWKAAIQTSNSNLKIYTGIHQAIAVEPDFPIDSRETNSVGIFSGIGNPESFRQTVLRLGFNIKLTKVFKDHHHFKPDDLNGIFNHKQNPNLHWITTEKDAVRLQGLLENKAGWQSRLHTVPIRMHLQESSIEDLLDRLTQDSQTTV